MIKMTLAEICKNPANFMYLFADEERFLKYLDRKSAVIIRAKKRNQQQVLVNAVGADEYQNAIQQVKEAFVDVYDMTPQEALVTLANGGEVAGKNWAKGVYGVGALTKGTVFVQGKDVEVMPSTGYIVINGNSLTPFQMKRVYGTDKDGNPITTNYSYTAADGSTYTSQYDPKTGKYYAYTYTTPDGIQQTALGASMTDADSSSVWVAVLNSLSKIVEWIINLFKGDRTAITAENTLPNQVQDGFVQESSMSWIWVLLLAGGALLYGMPKVDTGKKKSK